MKLIVGLGNPGSEYHGTRHNVGFEVVEEVARRWDVVFRSARADAVLARSPGVPGGREAVILVKPLTFMNRSGEAVGTLQRYYRVALWDLLVISEDVNLPLGQLRARRQGSAGGHNGLRSVIEGLGTERIARVRVGVGRGDPRHRLASRVLSRFEPDERPAIEDAVSRAAEAVDLFVDAGIEPVMNQFNQRETADDTGEAQDG